MKPTPREAETVVVVSERASAVQEWARWLEEAGFASATCPGPYRSRRCPRLDGLPCPIRQDAVVAVVEIMPPGETELYGGWAERFCTRLPDDGATVLVGGSEIQDEMWGWTSGLAHPVGRQDIVRVVRGAVRRRPLAGSVSRAVEI